MSRVPHSYLRLFRREILDVCAFIFIADIVTGVPTPIFSLYATALGASLGLLGVLTAMLGLGRLLSALPIGMISDRLGRKSVLVGGMLVFCVAFLAYAATPTAEWLVVPRLLQAIAMVATFPLGIAYIGDIVPPRDRPAAIGVYTAAMGSGFAVGPLIGSWIGANAGYPEAYLAGAVIAFSGAVFGALRLVRAEPGGGVAIGAGLFDLPALRPLIRQPVMLMACVANIAMTLSMTGAIFTYFPLYARAAGISTVTIGTLFAWRAIASASGRIPMGPLSTRLPARWTLAAALMVEAAINVSIPHTRSATLLTALLILEGIGFGVFLVSGQSAVAAAAGQHNRGAAVGMFWMAGSLGDLFGPIGLGVVAQAWGLVAVFQGVGIAVASAAALIAALGLLELVRLRRGAVKDAAQDGGVDVAAGDDAHHAAVGSEPLQAGRH